MKEININQITNREWEIANEVGKIFNEEGGPLKSDIAQALHIYANEVRIEDAKLFLIMQKLMGVKI